MIHTISSSIAGQSGWGNGTNAAAAYVHASLHSHQPILLSKILQIQSDKFLPLRKILFPFHEIMFDLGLAEEGGSES